MWFLYGAEIEILPRWAEIPYVFIQCADIVGNPNPKKDAYFWFCLHFWVHLLYHFLHNIKHVYKAIGVDAKSEFAYEGQKLGQMSLSAKMRKYVLL